MAAASTQACVLLRLPSWRLKGDSLMSSFRKHAPAAVAAAMALLCLPTAIIASPIVIMYGGLGGHAGGGPPSTFDGWIATINQTTGAVTPIGHPAGVSRLSGLAFDSNGNLFGATQGNFPFP